MLRLPAHILDSAQKLAQSLPDKGDNHIVFALSDCAAKNLLEHNGRIVFAPATKPQVFK
jgi:hypothetical protein